MSFTTTAPRAQTTTRCQPDRRKGPPTAVRLKQITRFLQVTYGFTLPDNDVGRNAAFIALCHIAYGPEAVKRMRHWLGLWTPWMLPAERDDLIARAIWQPLRFTADRLGRELGCTEAIRTKYQLWTIGACGRRINAKPAAASASASASVMKATAAPKGAKPRAQYEAESLARIKPWEAEGISRRTWYRRRGTGPSAALFLSSTETRTCAKPRPSRPRPASSLPAHFLAGVASPDRRCLAQRSSTVAPIGHEHHRGWLGGEVITFQVNATTMCALQSAWALARGDHGPRRQAVS